MARRLLILAIAVVVVACDGHVGEMKLVTRQPVEDAPADAREVRPGTYVKTLKLDGTGEPIQALQVFGYAETINPQSPRDSVTSLEEGRPGTIPVGLHAVFASARIGETRRVWSCSGDGRSLCLVSEYTFYRQPE